MKEFTYPGSYESHLRGRVRELEREIEQLKRENHRLKQMIRERDEMLDRMA